MTGLHSVAPAATALWKKASTSSTSRWRLTAEPPSVGGALPLRAGLVRQGPSISSTGFPSLGLLGLALRSIETPRWGRLFSHAQQTWPFSSAPLRICDVLYD